MIDKKELKKALAFATAMDELSHKQLGYSHDLRYNKKGELIIQPVHIPGYDPLKELEKNLRLIEEEL
jgi:hypothetical protein